MRTSEVHGRIFYLTGGKPCFFLAKAMKGMIWGRPPIIDGLLMTLGYCKAAFRREKLLVSAAEAELYNKLLSERIISKAQSLL